MESNRDLDKLLKSRLRVSYSDIEDPDPSLVTEARRIVSARKKPEPQSVGFVEILVSIFTFRVKLYQAGISTLLIGGLFFYFEKISEIGNSDQDLLQHPTESTAVKSSTVLTSIFTLVARD